MIEVLKAVKSRWHVFLEDRVLYQPKPGSKELPPPDARAGNLDPAFILSELHTKGMIIFPNFLSQSSLTAELDKLCDDAYTGKRSDLKVGSRPGSGALYVENSLNLSPLVAQVGLDPFLVAIMEAYFQHDIYLSDIDMRRVLAMSLKEFEQLSPENSTGYSSCHWHCDSRGRQLKIMVYLTDVLEGMQNFAYCAGTHRVHPKIPRDRLDYRKHRFPEGWPEANGINVVECLGKAGTVMIFDTNAIHRLRRSNKAVRDSITYYYTPGQQLKPIEFNNAALEKVPADLRRLLGGERNF